MLITIYNIYSESLVFVRKNIFVVAPFYLFEVLKWIRESWSSGYPTFDNMVYFSVYILLFGLCVVFVIVAVYKREGIIAGEETIWQASRPHFGGFLLLAFYIGFAVMMLALILAFLAVLAGFPAFGKVLVTPLVIVTFIFFPLSLRHMIYHNNIFVTGSIKGGLAELYKNFFFYICVFVSGILVSNFPSLLSPVSWSVFPFMPIVEWTGVRQINAINWFGVLLYPFVSAVIEVSLTYAFILKNKKPVIS